MEAKEAAFVARKGPEIFHSIQHMNDIWLPDPFDVPTIHQEARELFGRLVEQARGGRLASGRILVVRGEAGAGKTHLMRAFRNRVHEDGSAFFAYMQMTTSAMNYERYVLQNLIDSLQQPYRPDVRRTSLQVLSDRLVEMLPRRRVEDLRDADSGKDAGSIVHELADRLVDRNDLPPVDPDLIRALLFLQVGRPSVMTKVCKYLRAEPLSDFDRETLGGIAPLHADDAPLRNVKSLASLIRTPLNRALVLCVDQLEDMFNLDAAKERFPRAMSAVTSIASLPSVVVVVSCLEQFYLQAKQFLSLSTIHRLEQGPEPVVLSGMRTRLEAEAIISRRLNHLWSESGLAPSEGSTEPLPEPLLEYVTGQQTRSILAVCARYRDQAIRQGRLGRFEPDDEVERDPLPIQELTQAWNDARTAPQEVPEEEADRAALLRAVLPLLGRELGVKSGPEASGTDRTNELRLIAPWMKTHHIVVTEASPQGGRLLRQINDAAKRADEATLVLVRSDPFAKSPRAQTQKALGRIVAGGGRGVILSDADWRQLIAFRQFHAQHSKDPRYLDFRQEEMPLLSLSPVREIFDVENLEIAEEHSAASQAVVQLSGASDASANSAEERPLQRGTTEEAMKPGATETQAPKQDGEAVAASESTPRWTIPAVDAALEVGVTMGLRNSPVQIQVNDIRRHAAFLGSTGSGKTTAATMVIEQLLARQIPAILIDRKGDLCGYGLNEVWEDALDDPQREALRQHLRKTTRVQLFTPGAGRGRNLSVPLVAPNLQECSEEDRESAAHVAADGLASMMHYGTGRAHKAGRAAIKLSIRYLVSVGEAVTLDSLIRLLSNPDEELVAELGNLFKYCEATVTDLEILKLDKSALLSEDTETLDIDLLLRPAEGGRVPLSIISTKFLGGESDVQFWVAQLLVQINRWLDRNPSSQLQGIVMLDEADLYLPATSNPVSKRAVEDLLRRARSKGFGVMLATQSPGDLDYKCRDNIVTWFVGLVAQPTALKKLEPMFRDTHVETERLASQKVGEFHLLQEGQVRPVKTHLNAVPLPSQVADEQILALAREGRPSRLL